MRRTAAAAAPRTSAAAAVILPIDAAAATAENNVAADVHGVHIIPDMKVVKLKLRYLVKWTGYDVSNNTCEPEEHAVHPALIAAFEIESPSADRDAIAEIAEERNWKKRAR